MGGSRSKEGQILFYDFIPVRGSCLWQSSLFCSFPEDLFCITTQIVNDNYLCAGIKILQLYGVCVIFGVSLWKVHIVLKIDS